MRLRSGLFVATFALAALGLSTVQQQEQQPSPLTARIEVSLVNVDGTVTSRGEPLRGLTRDDFEILEDGVPQTITNFYAIEPPTPPSAVVEGTAPPAPQPQPAAPDDERF